MMNRVRDIIRKRNEDIPFDEVEEEKDEQDFDAKYQDDNLADLVEEMRDEGKLTAHEQEYLSEMLEAAEVSAQAEKRYQSVMKITTSEPIYVEWLENVYGVSHTLTARLLHRFGYCEDFPTVSKLWSYSGLAPGQERTRGEKLGYDPQAKTLAWLVADRMIMQGERSRYKAEFYDPYKQKQVNRMEASECTYCGEGVAEHAPSDPCEEWQKFEDEDAMDLSGFALGDRHPDNATPAWSRGHADNRARRYLAKQFLSHYWTIARDLMGLDTPDMYVLAEEDHEKREDVFDNAHYARRVLARGD